jgi:hypothetical protein
MLLPAQLMFFNYTLKSHLSTVTNTHKNDTEEILAESLYLPPDTTKEGCREMITATISSNSSRLAATC